MGRLRSQYPASDVFGVEKRIAAAVFLWFLDRNEVLDQVRLPQSNLVAMTLMIAESRPEEREILVRIVTHLLCSGESP